MKVLNKLIDVYFEHVQCDDCPFVEQCALYSRRGMSYCKDTIKMLLIDEITKGIEE